MAAPAKASCHDVELMDQELVARRTLDRSLQDRQERFAIDRKCHAFESTARCNPEWSVELGDAVRPEQAGKPRRSLRALRLQIRAVTDHSLIGSLESRKITEEIDGPDVRTSCLNFE